MLERLNGGSYEFCEAKIKYIEKAIDIVRNSNKEDIILIFNDIELLINKNSMVNDIALIWYLKSKLRELNKDLC